jgi:hypothetical protein
MKLHELLEEIITEENKQGYTKVNIIRVGGLSATPHDDHVKNRKNYYHTPPNTKGIFVFLQGYVDRELYSWKYKTQKGLKMKTAPYKGKIWTHMKVQHKDVKYYKHKGSWHETDTDSLSKIFSLYKKPSKNPEGTYGKNPHYELFIEKQHVGSI